MSLMTISKYLRSESRYDTGNIYEFYNLYLGLVDTIFFSDLEIAVQFPHGNHLCERIMIVASSLGIIYVFIYVYYNICI